MNWRLLLLLSLAHMTVDTFGTYLTPLLPILEKKFAMDEAEMAALLVLMQLSSAFTQPFWGYLSDRMGQGLLVLAGPAVAAVFIGAVGLAPNYAVLMLLAGTAGLGVAAFHPEGTALAAGASGLRKAFGVSIFVVAGHFGLALGPSLAGWLTERHGLHASWWLVPPALVLLAVLAVCRRGARSEVRASRSYPWRELVSRQRPVIALLFALSVLRSFVVVTYASGMPFWWEELGLGPTQIGRQSGLFLFSGGLAGFLCGLLIRPGREKPWLWATFALALPALLLLPLQPTGWRMLVLIGLAGAMLNATVPAVIVYAQRQLPGAEGLASALMLGLAWGTGGIVAAALLRWLQHSYGNALVLQYACLALVPALLCAVLLPGAARVAAAAAPRDGAGASRP